MPRVMAVVRPDLGSGLALTGMTVQSTEDPAEALRLTRDAVDSREFGILIVDQGFMDEFDERSRHALESSNFPIVIPIPGKLLWQDYEQQVRDDYVAGLVRRAVGYQLDIRL